MDTIKKPIILDDTGKDMLSIMHIQNAKLGAIAREYIGELGSWKDIQSFVRQGFAKDLFGIGDQFIVPWTDRERNVTYQVPLDIVHFDDVELKDGSVVPAVFLQWHYAIPFGVQFDAAETVRATGTFSSDYWYYEKDGSTCKLLTPNVDYVIGTTIPTDKIYYVSAIKDTSGKICTYGYNRWAHSGLRQFLNTDGAPGTWWTAQHVGDTAPRIAATKYGFMSGFDDDFRSVLGPVKILTALNNMTDSALGLYEYTYDTFFLPSVEQVHGIYTGGVIFAEGPSFEYWKRATGSAQPIPTGISNEGYITYDIANKSSAKTICLRTCGRGSSLYGFVLTKEGKINSQAVYFDACCTPVCAIY